MMDPMKKVLATVKVLDTITKVLDTIEMFGQNVRQKMFDVPVGVDVKGWSDQNDLNTNQDMLQ